MNLEELIQKDLVQATINKEVDKVATLRLIKSEIMKAKTAPGFANTHELNSSDGKSVFLTDSEVQKIMQKMCKEREEASELYKANGRDDLYNKEISEKNIISFYLPKQATSDEVESIVISTISEIGASTMKDMGAVIKSVSAKLGSRSDGKTISTIVKNILSKK